MENLPPVMIFIAAVVIMVGRAVKRTIMALAGLVLLVLALLLVLVGFR